MTATPGGRTLSDYHINVLDSDEDCSAFGSTPKEGLAELAKAEEAWLTAARATGKAIPEPRGRP